MKNIGTMRRKQIGLLILALLIFLGVDEYRAEKVVEIVDEIVYETEETEAVEREPGTYFVKSVYDGDTFTLESGEKVRLIGINAPEVGEPYSLEARDTLRSMTLGKEVVLVKDKSDRDKYGRLLRFVYVDDVFVNKAIIEQGLALAASYYPDTTMDAVFKDAENTAKEKRLGLWNSL